MRLNWRHIATQNYEKNKTNQEPTPIPRKKTIDGGPSRFFKSHPRSNDIATGGLQTGEGLILYGSERRPEETVTVHPCTFATTKAACSKRFSDPQGARLRRDCLLTARVLSDPLDPDR